MKSERQLYWADKKEVVRTGRPLRFLFFLLTYIPAPVCKIIAYFVSFFFFLFGGIRDECRIYQRRLKKYTDGQIPARVSPYLQILSFSFCIIEKMQGWMGRIGFENIAFQDGDDDIGELLDRLRAGKGAFVISSHQGNMELLRSLANFDRTGVGRKIQVTAIIEMKTTAQFGKILQEINPDVGYHVIAPESIGPDTICTLIDQIQGGGLVVCAGDRTSARTRGRFLTEKFLGEDAAFPYGAFLLAALLNEPVYFVFGLRTKTFSLSSKYSMFIKRSKINFDCPREERADRIKALCAEFVGLLEKYCRMFPYQWYNFYDFWLLPEVQ